MPQLVRGIVQVVFNKRDGEVEGQGRKSDRLRGKDPLSLARARLETA